MPGARACPPGWAAARMQATAANRGLQGSLLCHQATSLSRSGSAPPLGAARMCHSAVWSTIPSRPQVTCCAAARARRSPPGTLTMRHAAGVLPAERARGQLPAASRVGPPRESGPHQPGAMEDAGIRAGRALAGPARSQPSWGRPGYIAYPGGVPHICGALESASTVVIALGHVEEGVQNAAPVPGPDRCPRAG
jgi:hypothetical protein